MSTKSEADDASISDTDSYFSSRYEPEYLTRLSLATGSIRKGPDVPRRKQSFQSARSGTQRSCTSTRASFRTSLSSLSSLSVKSDGVIYDFPAPPGQSCLHSPGFSPSSPPYAGSHRLHPDSLTHCSQESPPGVSTPQPELTSSTPRVRHCVTDSDTSETLPGSLQPGMPMPEAVGKCAYLDDDFVDEFQSDFVTAFRARLTAPHRQRRAAFEDERRHKMLQLQRSLDHTLRSKMHFASPALVGLNVPLSADVDLWIDDFNSQQSSSDSQVTKFITSSR